LDVLYEDPGVIAVNKPAGIAVHSGAGCHSGTLVNALLHRFGALSEAGGELRPGIVHRLDRYTSGVILVARNDPAHRALAQQFGARAVRKVYVALVQGLLKDDAGRIDKPISRDPVRRIRMAVREMGGRAADTRYTVLRRFTRHTLLDVTIGTGRTHQIRVHMASIGHPVAGDTVYGAARTPHGRFFLHARSVTFESPATGLTTTVEAPLPEELLRWLEEPL
jgi:23S rRNA pseudouridine1911/1915/1917 synthase